jgi:hypothetical protein
VFTARYALSPYIKQICFVFKGLNYYLGGLHTWGMAQGKSRGPVIAEASVESQVCPCEIYGRYSDTRTDFSTITSGFPC